jgi:hypothetical protein
MQLLSIRSFLTWGYQYDLYTYDPTLAVPPGVRLRPAGKLVRREEVFTLRGAGRFSGSYAAFSNLFRYRLLFERGGWWADLDMICLRPLDFEDVWVFAAQRRRSGEVTTSSCLIKAQAQSDLIGACLEKAQSHPTRESEWGAIGPGLLDREMHSHGLGRFRRSPETFCPVDWWCAADLLKPGEIPRNSVNIHLWNEVWRQAGWPCDPVCHPNTLYQSLHSQFDWPEKSIKRQVDG